MPKTTDAAKKTVAAKITMLCADRSMSKGAGLQLFVFTYLNDTTDPLESGPESFGLIGRFLPDVNSALSHISAA